MSLLTKAPRPLYFGIALHLNTAISLPLPTWQPAEMSSCSLIVPNLNLKVLGKRTICYSLLRFPGSINAYISDIFPLIYKREQMRVKCGMNAG